MQRVQDRSLAEIKDGIELIAYLTLFAIGMDFDNNFNSRQMQHQHQSKIRWPPEALPRDEISQSVYAIQSLF